MSQGNPISRTGLLVSPRKYRRNQRSKSKLHLELNFSQCAKSMQYSLRPFAGLFNPYSQSCSILCNHPGPNEIKQVVKQVKERCDLSPVNDKCVHTCSDDVSCDLVNVSPNGDLQKESEDYFHYADSDSRPLTPTNVSIISSRTRVSQNSFLFHRRRCHTPDPVNTSASERKQLVLDLRRSHSQETIYCNASSEISIQADSVTFISKSIQKIPSSPPPKNMRLCEQEARKKSAERKAAMQLQSEEPVPSTIVCINDRADVDEEVDGARRRGKKKKKQKDGNTFQVNQEPETQITTLGPDSPNASGRPPMANKVAANRDLTNDSNVERSRDSQYLRSNFITEDALKILRRGLNIDIVESAFEKFVSNVEFVHLRFFFSLVKYFQMNTALKEALQTIPKDQFNRNSAALLEFKQTFGVDCNVKNDKWLVMPRQFARSATRFSLPINTQKLATLTPFEYLSQYVWCSDHRKHLYRYIFNKYLCDATDEQQPEDDCDNESERDTPSNAANEKSMQAYVFKECIMPFGELTNAFKNVLGYCGPIDEMSEKISTIIEITNVNDTDNSTINFRSFCGLVAFAERYLNNTPFEEDPLDEVSLQNLQF